MKPYFETKLGTLYHGDCLDILPGLPKVDLCLTDPPYMGCVQDDWDNQWASDHSFLQFVKDLTTQFSQLLEDNGSLYFFASSRLSSKIELVISEQFNVLNHIVWSKGDSRNGVAGTGIDITALRKFWTATSERLIFAEKFISDSAYNSSIVYENSDYFSACEKAKSSIMGEYLKSEFKKAGVSNRQIASLFPSKTGGVTGCVSNWLNGDNFPTKDQYLKIREYLNMSGEYEYLRREYEDLRREYEDLRRPFYPLKNGPWGDVWVFNPPKKRFGHPCQKPFDLISHILKISSRKNDTVLDPFIGSGTTAVACEQLRRRWIGIELSEKYCEIAAKRIEKETAQLDLFEDTKPIIKPKQEEMFA